jgi:hypothetical protein
MATELGVSKSQVARDKAAGMPMGDVESARAWRLAQHDVARTADGRIDRPAVQTSAPAPRSPAGEGPPAEADDEPSSEDTATYRRERAEREKLRRQREEIELAQLRGNLVDRAEVVRLRFTEFRALRDALGNLGPRLAPTVALEADALRCEQMYAEALEEVLNAFADQVLTRHVLADVDEDDDDDAAPAD